MFLNECDLTVVDFESTGTVPGYRSEPWQIGMVRFRRGRVVPDETFCSLLNVGPRPFSPHAPGRHAELRDKILRAPRLDSLWAVIRPWLDVPACMAHNAATEKAFLAKAFPLHPVASWVDTLPLARTAYPSHSSHRLEDLSEDLGLRDVLCKMVPGRAPHDALYDAVSCGLLLQHLLEHTGWQKLPIGL